MFGREDDRLLRERLLERDVSRRLRLRLRLLLRVRLLPFLFLPPAPPAGFFFRSALRLLEDERDESEPRERLERERDFRPLRPFDLDLDLDLDRVRLTLFFLLMGERDLDRDRDVERVGLRRFPAGETFLPSAMFINFDCSLEMDPLSTDFSLTLIFLRDTLRERLRLSSRLRPSLSRSRLSLGERLRFLERSGDRRVDRERRRSREDLRSLDDLRSRDRRRSRERDRSRDDFRRDLSGLSVDLLVSFGFSGDFFECRSVEGSFTTGGLASSTGFLTSLSLEIGTSASIKSSIIFSSSSRYSSGSGLYIGRTSFFDFL